MPVYPGALRFARQPGALITKACGPIIGMGALDGSIIGVIIGKFGY
jgi:hypothetical protein